MTSKGDDRPTEVFAQDGTVADWDRDYYHPISESYYDVAVADMLRLMGAGSGDTVLDAGCGPGVHSIRAAQSGCRVVAVDISDLMLRHARERAEASGLAGSIEFLQGDLTDLNLGRTFDYCFSWGVIIHIPDPLRAIDHIARHVAPGGKLALHVLNRDSLDFRLERFLRWLLRKPLPAAENLALGTGNWYQCNDKSLWVMRFDTKALRETMADRGFRQIALRTAEFSEIQRRLAGALRSSLLRLNRVAYRRQFLPGLSCTQIIVFEKV
jgi:ubiquinone/menaquinone biosynthesis C-methylase UbiE